MEQNNGQLMLMVICCTPFLAGLATGVTIMLRVMKIGLWGVIPFGDVFKNWWMERRG